MVQARRLNGLGRWGCGIALLLLLIALALAPGATPVVASTVTVRMLSGHLFQPADITIRPGTTVMWINKDISEAHNVAEAIGVFGTGGVSLAYDGTYTYTFPQGATGIYYYSCTLHPGMDGSVTILNTTPTATATNPPIPEPLRHANAVPTVTATSVPVPLVHTAAPTRASVNTPRAQPARH